MTIVDEEAARSLLDLRKFFFYRARTSRSRVLFSPKYYRLALAVFFTRRITERRRKTAYEQNNQTSKTSSLLWQKNSSTAAVWRAARLPIFRRDRTTCFACCLVLHIVVTGSLVNHDFLVRGEL